MLEDSEDLDSDKEESSNDNNTDACSIQQDIETDQANTTDSENEVETYGKVRLPPDSEGNPVYNQVILTKGINNTSYVVLLKGKGYWISRYRLFST